VKKNAIFVLVAASTMALCLALIPNVLGQPENVTVLSYNWYTSPYSGDIVVVGEVQNIGPNVIDYIIVTGTFYTPDGTAQMSNDAQAFAAQILPQEKAPFYIDFPPQTSITGDYSWASQGIENVTLVVNFANPTDSRQYQDLVVSSHTSSVDSTGLYVVTGVVQNTGTQATNQTVVSATFYNATGGVVAVGYSNYLTPSSIAPGGTASFTVYAFDSNLSGLAAQITSYALLIQTSITAPSTTPSPSPSTTPSPSPSQPPTSSPTSSSSPTPTEPGKGTSIPDMYVYAAVAVVIIVIVIVAAALLLRKRRSGRTVSS